jgi:hypothetical protein
MYSPSGMFFGPLDSVFEKSTEMVFLVMGFAIVMLLNDY